MPVKKRRGKAAAKKKESSVEPECNEYLYERNEVILCYHGPCLYKAKVLKRTVTKQIPPKPLYFVHYHGWNQQWDEWVDHDRCLKNTVENVEKMKQINAIIQEKTKNEKNSKQKAKKRSRQIHDSEDSESDSNANSTNAAPYHHQQHDQKQQERAYQAQNSDNSERPPFEDPEESKQPTPPSTDTLNEEEKQKQKEQAEVLQKLYQQKYQLKSDDLDDSTVNAKIKSLEHEKKERKKKCNSKEIEINMDEEGCMHLVENDEPGNQQTERERDAKLKWQEKLKTITIPTALKDSLVQQYNLIHYDEKLIKLPKAKGFRINDILNEVLHDQRRKLKQKKAQQGTDVDDVRAAETIAEILPFINDGLRGFFKNTLAINLLYNFEKPQLEMLSVGGRDLCDIYGAEHLIRLFYMLPNILLHTDGVNDSNFSHIKQCVSIIIQYLVKHKAKYLIDFNELQEESYMSENTKNRNGSHVVNVEEHVESVSDEYIAQYRKIAKSYDNKYQSILSDC
eukprot:CAMPEP_0197023118 /NCGR_PEP_ID=MMETSP1384-20130603/3911_1 /TAXON_ID=29189 /ORGANISM="Ammonia sp." /LENGTH=507 /DNA_ID=CAMNT_0042451289 /DNA_START=48 /DNA_END=1571 /DNA_ORIENTATION=+